MAFQTDKRHHSTIGHNRFPAIQSGWRHPLHIRRLGALTIILLITTTLCQAVLAQTSPQPTKQNFRGKIEYDVSVEPAKPGAAESEQAASRLGKTLPKTLTVYSDGQNLRFQQQGVEKKSYGYHFAILVQELGQAVYELDADEQEALKLRLVSERLRRKGLPFQQMTATGEQDRIKGYTCKEFETVFSDGDDEPSLHLNIWFAPELKMQGLHTEQSFGRGQMDNFMLWMMVAQGALPLAFSAELKRNSASPAVAHIHFKAVEISMAPPAEKWFKIPPEYSINKQFSATETEAVPANEQTERERPEREQTEREQTEREQTERERPERERRDKPAQEPATEPADQH